MSVLQDWFTPDQIDRRTLWRWLEPDACRLAACYWWPTLPLSDLQGMMRLYADLAVRRNPGLSREVTTKEGRDKIAHAVLDEAIASMWQRHADTYQSLLDAAAQALRGGCDRSGVLAAVLPMARQSTPMPPPWLVQEAIEKAAREYRFETKFWQRRRRAG